MIYTVFPLNIETQHVLSKGVVIWSPGDKVVAQFYFICKKPSNLPDDIKALNVAWRKWPCPRSRTNCTLSVCPLCLNNCFLISESSQSKAPLTRRPETRPPPWRRPTPPGTTESTCTSWPDMRPCSCDPDILTSPPPPPPPPLFSLWRQK